MPDLSVVIPELQRNISSGYVETLIQARREELFTGLMRLHYPSGENLVFTFVEGVQQKLYRCLENSIDILPRHTWFHALDHPNTSVGFMKLPVEAMRFIQVAYEAPVVRMEDATMIHENLTDAVARWAGEPNPCIVHLQTEKSNRYYLIAGHTPAIIEELSFAEGQARFSIGDTSFAKNLPAARYRMARFVSDCKHTVWRDYDLRLAFNPFVRILVHRFSELAGRALTDRLCERLSLWAREEGWNIVVTGNGVLIRQYFDSLESAISVYAELLRRYGEEASLAIGARMVDGIARETLIKLDPYRRELLTQSIYSQFGVGNVTGVVWR